MSQNNFRVDQGISFNGAANIDANTTINITAGSNRANTVAIGADGSISTVGNITGHDVYANGNLYGAHFTFTCDTVINQTTSPIYLQTDAQIWQFGTNGNITLPSNTAAINYANGQPYGGGGGGSVSELVNGNNSLVLDGDGNIVLEGTPSGNAINRGLVWDYGANANGVNSTLRQDNGGLTLRAWTENCGGANGYSAPVSIITNQDTAAKAWEFDGQGNLTVPSGSINSINDGGELGAYITLTPDLGIAKLAARNAQSNVNYTSTSWTSGTYTGTQVDFVDAPDLVSFFNSNQFNDGVNQTFSINGGEPVPFTGYSIGASNAVTVYTSITPEPDPTTVTSIDFLYQLESYVSVDYDGGELNIAATGLTILIDNDQTEGPDIVLRSGDDITLQAKDMSLGSEREGGDINIYAGDGADDDGGGNTASTGGDIQITAGNGGDGNSSTGSSGGFTTISGGSGGAAGVTNTAGPGGYVSIQGGDGGTNNGNTALGAGGGNISITAGLSTQEGVNGPDVAITSGQGGPNALAGSVLISTPASVNGLGGTWTFDGDGILTVPGEGIIQSINDTIILQSVDANSNVYSARLGTNGGLYFATTQYPQGWLDISNNSGNANITAASGTAGAAGKNMYITAGAADQSDFYTTAGGSVNLTGGLGASNDGGGGGPGGNVNLITGNSSDSAGHAGNVNIDAGTSGWTFDYTGNLTLPANTFAVNYANGSPVVISGGSGNTGNVTFDDQIIIGTGDEFGGGGLYLAMGPTSAANLQYLRVRGGDYPTHIHLDTGNNQYYDQYFGADSRYVKLEANGNIVINADDYNGNSGTWNFDIAGNLTVPGNIQSVTTGFSFTSTITGVNTGSSTVLVTLTDSVFGAPETGQVTISGVVGTTEANNTWYFASIDPSNFQLYNDAELTSPVDGTTWTSYVSGGLAAAAGYSNISITGGNVEIVTNTGNTWTFTSGGNLILADGNSIIQSIANSSLDPVNPNVSTMVFTPDPGYSTQALVLDPTAPGHIHLRAPGANIDEPLANIFLGGEDSSFEVGYYNGSAPNLFIHSNTNTWTFENTGNLTLPGNLNYIGASPAPSINGFDSADFAGNLTANYFISNSANITGNLVVSGKITSNVAYTSVFSDTIVTYTANTPQTIQFNNTDSNNIIALGTGASNSRVIFNRTGLYNVQFSAQIDKTGGGTANVAFWLRKNGTDLSNTAGYFNIDSATQLVQSWNFLVDAANTTDYVELATGSSTNNVVLPALAANTLGYTHPEIPSVILTVVPVGT